MIDNILKYKNEDGTYTCPICHKTWKSKKSLSFHYNHCSGNTVAWNKGLTKHNNNSLKSASDKLLKRYNDPNEREKLKKSMAQISYENKERIREGGRKGGLKSSQNIVKRSKNEIHFYNLCKLLLPNCNITHNEPFFDNWDADIIIHDNKLAILWNGLWHYKILTKAQKLEQVQSRDKIKIDIIKKYGYIPYIIKDLGKENPEFVKEQFLQFVKYYYNDIYKMAVDIANNYTYKVSEILIDIQRKQHKKIYKKKNCEKVHKNKVMKRAKIISRIHKIRLSDIDFSKDGWLGKVALLVKMNPRNVHKWMRKYMPTLYKTCHHR